MGKNINIVLRLQDKFSEPINRATGKIRGMQKEVRKSTRLIRSFGNTSSKILKSMAGTAGKILGIGGGGLAGAFLAAGRATEEYRQALGRLNTAFSAAGLGAEAAKESYRQFYQILGDTDTATEASQLLAKLTKNEQDVSKWTRIAAGVSGTFGDALPIESLIEAANETQNTGKVVGTLADALNWAGISEDAFNRQLAAASDPAERNRLIMETLGSTYEKAAEQFYKNNEALVAARNRQALLQEITGKLGEASEMAKNKIMTLLGATEDGGVKEGSVLDMIMTGIDNLKAKLEDFDAAAYTDKVAGIFEKVGGAVKFLTDHANILIPVLLGVTTALGLFSAAAAVVNVVLMANPIGLIIAAVAALIGIITALILNWEKVKEVAGNVIDAVVGFVTDLKDAVVQLATEIKDGIVGAFQWVKEKITGIFDWFKGKFDWVANKLSGLRDKANEVLGFTGESNYTTLATYGGKATGTPYFQGGLTRINEGGRGEIVDLPNGTRIIPHDVAEKAVQSAPSVTVNLTVQGNVIGNRTYMEEVGSYIAKKVLLAQGVV